MSGNMAENAAGLDVGNAVDSAEKEHAGQTRPLSPAPTSLSSPRRSPDDISSPSPSPQLRSRHMSRRNCTRFSPFSFDLRDSMRRVARERKLEKLRLMEESRLAVAVTFRANPVRKYKPLVPKQSTRQLTVPRSPFSSGDP
ncbi:siaz-interacting nuclear protein isoform X2 [Pangasianodon hypophthalmus]|uniref:siaz-interacting nuclear protein isoform X2 n=1 Tax=Pangasianodon hypophthalmus TaxID=310915 RepID=UPI00147CB2F9|nr:siaz-interacting nuclear protein isoform X2 [Pangasianodon hypophthalmus]